jgi:hypothetical protein
VALSYRACQPAHLPPKLKVIAARGNAVGVAKRDDRQAENESHQDYEPDRLAKRPPCRRGYTLCPRLLELTTLWWMHFAQTNAGVRLLASAGPDKPCHAEN